MSNLENNKLIAEFMGMQDTDLGWYDSKEAMSEYACQMVGGNTFEELQYDRSWDWLMPVVRKCLDIYESIWKADFDRYNSKNLGSYESRIRNASGSGNMEATYRVVTEFINWCNTQTQKA